MFSTDEPIGEPNHDTPRTNTRPDEASDDSGHVQGPAASEPSTANGPRTAPDVAKKRAKKIETGDLKKGQGFSVAEDDWVKSIPPPGHYEATVVRASIHPTSNVAYLKIEYSIQNGDGLRFPVEEFLLLDADPQDSLYIRTAQGKSRVKAVMEANNRPLTFATIHEVPKAPMGCRAIIAVAHKNNDGLPVPIVREIVGPADPAKE